MTPRWPTRRPHSSRAPTTPTTGAASSVDPDRSPPRVAQDASDGSAREQARDRAPHERARRPRRPSSWTTVVSRADRERAAERNRPDRRARRDLLRGERGAHRRARELRSANEELIVASEEVQAATEEVETLNEELQATNEELETLNEELQATIEELNTTNDELQARSVELTETAASLAEQRQRSELERERLTLILDGMSEAVIVVGSDRTVVTTNRAYDGEFGSEPLVPEDGAGNPLPEAEWPHVRAANDETFSMSFTHTDRATGERRWYEATGRVAAGQWGNVVVLRDITDRSLRHLQERFIDTASHEFQTPLAALRNYLALVDRGAGDALDGEDPEVPGRGARAVAPPGRARVPPVRRVGDPARPVRRPPRARGPGRGGRGVGGAGADGVAGPPDRAAPAAREGHRRRGPDAAPPVDQQPARERDHARRLERARAGHAGATRPGRRGLRSRTPGPGIPHEALRTMFTPFTGSGSEGRTGLGLGLSAR